MLRVDVGRGALLSVGMGVGGPLPSLPLKGRAWLFIIVGRGVLVGWGCMCVGWGCDILPKNIFRKHVDSSVWPCLWDWVVFYFK